MKSINNKKLLSFGLGFVFIYAGVSSLVQPDMWIGFVPRFVESFGISRELVLYIHAIGDIVLGALFLVGKWKKWIGLSGFSLLLIIAFVSGTELFVVTFRDVGLALAALAYAFSE